MEVTSGGLAGRGYQDTIISQTVSVGSMIHPHPRFCTVYIINQDNYNKVLLRLMKPDTINYLLKTLIKRTTFYAFQTYEYSVGTWAIQ